MQSRGRTKGLNGAAASQASLNVAVIRVDAAGEMALVDSARYLFSATAHE